MLKCRARAIRAQIMCTDKMEANKGFINFITKNTLGRGNATMFLVEIVFPKLKQNDILYLYYVCRDDKSSNNSIPSTTA